MSEGHSTGIPTIQDELGKNGSPRAEFFTDDDRRATRICIHIHPAFLTENNLDVGETEKATKKATKKTQKQYADIRKLMSDGKWYKTSEVAEWLRLRETRTKQLLKEMVALGELEDDGKTKGKLYKIIRRK